ncbi:MAG: DUF1848 domain-containing protein [Spirochaetales bacterium]|nr:DUF1848 domain-containing protein [Spirochaetales bacterium]
MIVSVSRRTDIPAFYGKWFINRLRAGEVLVRNPLNRKQVSLIPLRKENVDCFVFWTKDPGPFLPYLDELDGYGIPYYFTITVTPYGREIEKNIRSKVDVIASIKTLAERIGQQRIIWRYDPVIFNGIMDVSYHLKAFEALASEMKNHTEKCVFSFLTEYGKIAPFVNKMNVQSGNGDERTALVRGMAQIAGKTDLQLASCALDEDYDEFGVGHNRCIDPQLIGRICGYPLSAGSDKSQREACGCIESRDIGTYNTCLHGCLYCYANRDEQSIRRKAGRFKADSPMLCDSLSGDEQITPCRNCGSLRKEDSPEFSFEF